MKKDILSLAVTAGVAGMVAGGANAAMHINDKGLGEVLIYPFYSAANGNDTYIHIANTTDLHKAVKVRFIGASNSAEVLDFNLYLSPQDMWTAAITQLPAHDGSLNGGFPFDGGVGIRTFDNSCTSPALGSPNPPFNGTPAFGGEAQEQPFTNFQFQVEAALAYPGSSSIPAEVEETSLEVRGVQGYVEIIEMGVLDPDADTGTAPGKAGYDYAGAITHDTMGVPADCGAVVSAWAADGVWQAVDPTHDFLIYSEENAGGLYGLAQVINVPDGTMASYDAVAIDDFYDADTAGRAHQAPSSLVPNLGSGQSVVTIFDGADATDYQFTGNNFDPVNALFMSTQIINDYMVSPVVKAQTDWVLTMPTKSAHVLFDRSAAADFIPASAGEPIRPFSNAWDGQRACESFTVSFWDREEAVRTPVTPGAGFSPRPPGQPASPDLQLCSEVSILTFNDGVNTDSSALKGTANLVQGINTSPYNEGWARVSFDPDTLNVPLDNSNAIGAGIPEVPGVPARQIRADDIVGTGATPGTGATFVGLPVTGFAVTKYVNESVSDSGAVSNYAASFKHKIVTSIAN